MTDSPRQGQDRDWSSLIARLDELSRQIQTAIKQEKFDKAKQLGDERLALLSVLVTQQDPENPFPDALVTLARQLLSVEAPLQSTLLDEKERIGSNIAKMVTGARANAMYKKNRQ
ncbi:hypothetical protein [Pseudaeromonas paramecii]|uniref:Flagellar protein FliT n=1 Tax=Pseudaeromonas paramecii TaxID=2138166 RepID=A0ABP8Q2U3_9GAMM